MSAACKERRKKFVSRCLEPSQPQGMVSRLRETYVKSYIVERTSKADMRPEEQSEKAGIVGGEFME